MTPVEAAGMSVAVDGAATLAGAETVDDTVQNEAGVTTTGAVGSLTQLALSSSSSSSSNHGQQTHLTVQTENSPGRSRTAVLPALRTELPMAGGVRVHRPGTFALIRHCTSNGNGSMLQQQLRHLELPRPPLLHQQLPHPLRLSMQCHPRLLRLLRLSAAPSSPS